MFTFLPENIYTKYTTYCVVGALLVCSLRVPANVNDVHVHTETFWSPAPNYICVDASGTNPHQPYSACSVPASGVLPSGLWVCRVER